MGIKKDDPVVERVPLSRPRPLTPNERALVEFLLAGPLGRDELRAQAQTAQVVAVCSCRCPSVWLHVDPATRKAEFRPDETPIGRTDWVPITAFQRKTRATTEVTLHVVQGLLEELEIWAGFGVRPRVDLAKLDYDDPRQSE
jgi:hypothetical protein